MVRHVWLLLELRISGYVQWISGIGRATISQQSQISLQHSVRSYFLFVVNKKYAGDVLYYLTKAIPVKNYITNYPKLCSHATLQHPKLKRLDVSRCNLDRPGLHGLPLLTHAHLSRNMIRILPDRIFAKNKQLTHLYLNANNLERLNASTFEGLMKLQLLDLSANNLEDIHRLAFQENMDLRLLNLSYNTFYRFPHLSCLVTSLDLSFNLISRFEADSLEDMPRIRNLILKDNQLQLLPRGLRSATLKILDVQRNRLVELHNNSFIGIPSLQKIDLSGKFDRKPARIQK